MAHHTTDPYTLAHAAQRRAIRARRRRQQRLSQASPPAQAAPAALAQSPTQRQGSQAEARALAYLIEAGLQPLAANLACRAGEIDLVFLEGSTLVFVEVRERKQSHFGGAAASIGAAKQKRLILAAQYWLPRLCRRYFAGKQPPCRFDAVTLDDSRIEWIRHAFALNALA
ncbi:YraN family protein [Pusillimonas sp. CC-YST705]|uniref:UPF0102 protein H0484_08000 n=1 Tax=Mesopusillimonas faecipullorum TaxID=2755040 RepID=A0ABS8CCC7_9BURK|nr:YraN family protein [Mesopusillimonas faecipullorum]MCB5363690.1 YraN family protein [Mesopusillimonas faecipullorum]